MILDDGETWDLSPKDKAALRHVLGLVNSMANDLAEATGLPVSDIIQHHGKAVHSAQKSAERPAITGRTIDFLRGDRLKPLRLIALLCGFRG